MNLCDPHMVTLVGIRVKQLVQILFFTVLYSC
jgi:hypothetical protein